MSGRNRDSTVRNVWIGAVLCFLLAVAAMTVLPWMMQQSMNTPQGVSREAYGWVVVGVQLLQAALFPLAAVLAGVGSSSAGCAST